MKTHFGPFAFDPSNQLLWRGGEEVPLPPRVVGVLGLLVARPGEVVSRQELIDAVWKDAFVSDTSLAEAISFLRQALGDDPQQPSYIQTVHRRGYRFLPPVNGAGAAAAPDASAVARDPWAQLLPWAIAIVLGAMAAAAVWRVAHPDAPQAAPIARFDVLLPGGATLDGSAPAIAFSPSGARLALSACDAGGRCQLLVRALDRVELQPLAGTEGAQAPFFSPDDASIAFFADGKLKTVPAAGGSPTTIAVARQALGGAWLDDGSIVFAAAAAQGLQRVAAAGGTPRAATIVDAASGELRHEAPDQVPGGDATLFTAVLAPDAPLSSRIVAVSRGTGRSAVVVDRASAPRFVAPNVLAFVRDGDLMAAVFDPVQLKLVGQPVVVVPHVGEAPAQYAVSRTGAIATAAAAADPGFALAWVGGGGELTPAADALQALVGADLSRDGRRIVAVRADGNQADVWWADVERGTLSRVTAGGDHRDPRWTADGRAVVVASRVRGGAFNLFERSVAESVAPRRLTETAHHQTSASVAPDGAVLFTNFDPATGADLWSVGARAGASPIPVLHTEFDETAPAVSPDGRWVAYQSNESNRWEVYARPLAGSGAAVPISSGGGTSPIWSREGRIVYYAGRDGVMATTVSACAGDGAAPCDLAPSKPVSIVRGPWIPRGTGADGRLLVERERGRLAGVDRIRVTLQWTRELQRIVPPAVVSSPK